MKNLQMEEPSRVSLYGWGLKRFPKLASKAMQFINKVNDGKTPERVIHVGVAVFHKFYHFTQEGLQISFEIPTKKLEWFPEPMISAKSYEEFEKWFNSTNIRTTFCSKTYHPIGNNCIDFALRACKFLGVSIQPGLHTTLNDWLKEHEKIVSLFTSPKLLRFFGVSFGQMSTTTPICLLPLSESPIAPHMASEDDVVEWETV